MQFAQFLGARFEGLRLGELPTEGNEMRTKPPLTKESTTND